MSKQYCKELYALDPVEEKYLKQDIFFENCGKMAPVFINLNWTWIIAFRDMSEKGFAYNLNPHAL